MGDMHCFIYLITFSGLPPEKKQMYSDAKTAISYAMSGDSVTINVGLVGVPGSRQFTFKLGEPYDSADLDGSPMKVPEHFPHLYISLSDENVGMNTVFKKCDWFVVPICFTNSTHDIMLEGHGFKDCKPHVQSPQLVFYIKEITSRSKRFHLYGDVTIAGEGLQN
jgi:hypothetical protein